MNYFINSQSFRQNGLFWILICIAFVQCDSGISNRSNKEDKIIHFFDLEGIVTKQIELLSAEKVKVIKTAKVDDEIVTDTVDQINWEKELNIFVNSDINKPKLFELYDSISSKRENGDQVMEYKLKENNSDGVLSMEICRIGDSQSLREIKINRCDDNAMIISEFELLLSFNSQSQNNRLRSYYVKGYEKMILKDTIRYEMLSKLL